MFGSHSDELEVGHISGNTAEFERIVKGPISSMPLPFCRPSLLFDLTGMSIKFFGKQVGQISISLEGWPWRFSPPCRLLAAAAKPC